MNHLATHLADRVRPLWKTGPVARQITYVDEGMVQALGWQQPQPHPAHADGADLPVLPFSAADPYQLQLAAFYRPQRLLFYLSALSVNAIALVKELLVAAGAAEAVVATSTSPDALRTVLSNGVAAALCGDQDAPDGDAISRPYDWVRLYLEERGADVLLIHHPIHTATLLPPTPPGPSGAPRQCELHLLLAPAARDALPLTLNRLGAWAPDTHTNPHRQVRHGQRLQD